MNHQIYRLHDVEPSGAIRTLEGEAHFWNQKGFGIFLTVNDFNGARVLKNLKRINALAIDIDTGTKDEMAEKIRKGLRPSMVVETKRGFHVWWALEDGSPEYWDALVLDRLVPFYGADRNARDICRILRMPGFYHMKNPKEPFLISKVYESKSAYTMKEVASFYPDRAEPVRKEFIARESRNLSGSGSLLEKIWRIDCMDGLEKLSGTEWVSGEVFTFRKNANGKFNIFVNGKSTSCFIDQNFRIGSLSGYGPTLNKWLEWYGHSKQKTIEIILEIYPELKNV